MFNIEEMLKTMTASEILEKAEAEIARIEAEQKNTSRLAEAREEVIRAFCNYMHEMIGEDLSDEEMAKFEADMDKELKRYERVLKPIFKFLPPKEEVKRPKIRMMSEEEADEILRDFLKGLK